MTNPPNSTTDEATQAPHGVRCRRRWRACAQSPRWRCRARSTPRTPATTSDRGSSGRACGSRTSRSGPNGLIERLNGDATVRGSLLWLQAQDRQGGGGRSRPARDRAREPARRAHPDARGARAASGEVAGAEAEVHRPRGPLVRIRLAGPARVAIAAVSIVLGAAACGSDEPAADRTDPPVGTSSPDTVAGPGVTEAEVIELEQQLDEIDRVLADLEAQLSED